MLRDYNSNCEERIILDEKSSFVVVEASKGKEMVVRKSSICWLMSKDKCKLSSDRLQRVQEKDYLNVNKGIELFQNLFALKPQDSFYTKMYLTQKINFSTF